MKSYEITIIVLNYNSYYDKIIETLDSILMQKNISFQVVVTDDGSKDNFFSRLEQYLKVRKFEDYKLCSLPENKGTVKNVLNGLENSDGRYIKCISPGDQLYGEGALRGWVDYLKSYDNCRWSFCDIICYHKTDCGEVIDEVLRHPNNIEPYIKKKDLSCRIEYIVFSDNVNGASILCERSFMLEYLKQIDGIVKFAEDNLWRIAIFDGYVPVYYPKVVIKYEYGTGISTSGFSKWDAILSNEWRAVTELLLKRIVKAKNTRLLKLGLIISETLFMRGVKKMRSVLRSIFVRRDKRYTIDRFPERE